MTGHEFRFLDHGNPRIDMKEDEKLRKTADYTWI
jgi:hypothetical protein